MCAKRKNQMNNIEYSELYLSTVFFLLLNNMLHYLALFIVKYIPQANKNLNWRINTVKLM